MIAVVSQTTVDLLQNFGIICTALAVIIQGSRPH